MQPPQQLLYHYESCISQIPGQVLGYDLDYELIGARRHLLGLAPVGLFVFAPCRQGIGLEL
jgi:hypothetical protein